MLSALQEILLLVAASLHFITKLQGHINSLTIAESVRGTTQKSQETGVWTALPWTLAAIVLFSIGLLFCFVLFCSALFLKNISL